MLNVGQLPGIWVLFELLIYVHS